MLRLASLAVVFLVAAASVRAQADKRDALEKSIDRALGFLKNHQDKDGSWAGYGTKHTAVSGLAVMAFLSAGHVPGEGPYGKTVEKGIRYVLAQQDKDGIFNCTTGTTMYHQGICTLMLAEVAGMTDSALGKQCRTALEKALAVLLRGQAKTGPAKGGWRYQPDGNDADLSITGWQVLALRAAKSLGCDVPVERIDMALEYVRNCFDLSTGGFCYTPGGGPTVPCTGVGVLCLEICSEKKKRGSTEALRAASYLLRNPIDWNNTHYFYGIYYGAQATFQIGGDRAENKTTRNNYWESYRPQLHKTLFAQQQANGSWLGTDGVGPSYSTAMGILALTVEYRLLPIYQRHEDARPEPKR